MNIPREESSSSLSNIHPKYDVFLSFRGLDTRRGFTAHLHKALKEANIQTFYDDEEIETGLNLKPELVNAIKASRASIIVLSENYASSTWCLEELALILDQNRTSNHIVFPIFFHVKPRNIRKQKRTFGIAMADHKKRMDAETDVMEKGQLAHKIKRWKNALIEVSYLKGKDAKGRLPTEFIEEIITDIRLRLCVLLRSNVPVLFGMEDHICFISSWLKDGSTHTADILTILGMGGIGKTSLAKYVYGRHSFYFQRSSFIVDINRRCDPEQSNKLLDLQKQLCSNISNTTSVQVNEVFEYTSMIENALESKKVLLVLDDVGNLDQMYALLGNRGFHAGSKIIITTKDASLTKKFKLFKSRIQPKHTVHLLEGLNKASSLQLLGLHASTSNGLKEGYEEVSKKLVKYCEGHPKALEVMGRDLCGLGVAEWEEYIDGLNKEMDARIEKVLRMSFDSLQSQNDKELFKYVASFFAGKDRVFVETILKACDIRTLHGIKNLTDRCLLTIGPRNELMMHQLLQDMGRDVVRQESRAKPWKRSRLWCHEDSFNVLQQNTVKRNLKGIMLDWRMLESHGSLELKTDALSTMDNLVLLQLNHVSLDGTYNNFPRKLRWLCMHGFCLSYIPPDLPMENLAVLDMSYSNIESFDMYYSNIQSPEKRAKLTGSWSTHEKGCLRSLKILNLSFCYQLRSLHGFLKLPALENLILASCRSLTEICESIGQCHELLVIDLSYCSMLKRLPVTVLNLKKLEAVSLDGCNLDEFPNNMAKFLNANRVHVDSGQVSSSDTMKALQIEVKPVAISLATSLVSWSLMENNLCMESFPMAFSSLPVSEKLIVDGNPVISLPNCVRSLRRIELLSKAECDILKAIKHQPCATRKLKFSRWDLLQKIISDPEMSPFKRALTIYSLAQSSVEIEGIVKIQPIASVAEDVLSRLGWNDLDFIKDQEVKTWQDLRRNERSQVQLFYEFGIFSTFYGGEEIPKWIDDKSTGSSISFTVPSSPNNLRGLNFCHLQTGRDLDDGVNLVTIIVSNVTKKCTWIYKHYTHWVKVNEECVISLSHWMFGKNEMEEGDQVTISLPKEDVSTNVRIRECGVKLVYDDNDDGIMEEEGDPLSYYKSWNHIIGGDLSAFHLTTGEYLLDNHRFFWWHIDCPVNRPFISNGACYKEKGVYFRGSPKASLSDIVEDITK